MQKEVFYKKKKKLQKQLPKLTDDSFTKSLAEFSFHDWWISADWSKNCMHEF